MDGKQQFRCIDQCNNYTLWLDNYSNPFCVQDCSFYGTWLEDLTTTCKDTCPASLPFKNVLQGTYSESPMIECLTKCLDEDKKLMDY